MKIVYDGSMDPRLCKSVLGETIPALAAEDPDFASAPPRGPLPIQTARSTAALLRPT